MPRGKLARLSFAVLAAFAFVACSDQSPVAPGATPDAVQPLTALAPGVPGLYELTFFLNGELVLTAHVEALVSGEPADGGAVTFQYCSYKGRPKNDITQPDEAPSSACEDGSATWVTLRRVRIERATGDASLNFGTVSVVNIIGFRGHYVSQNTWHR